MIKGFKFNGVNVETQSMVADVIETDGGYFIVRLRNYETNYCISIRSYEQNARHDAECFAWELNNFMNKSF
jgi:hypothetical protein